MARSGLSLFRRLPRRNNSECTDVLTPTIMMNSKQYEPIRKEMPGKEKKPKNIGRLYVP